MLRTLLPDLLASARASWWAAILRDHDTEPVELGSAVTKMILGVQLLLPLGTFENGNVFADLKAVPEWFVGVLLFGTGAGHLYALRDGSVSWRRAAAILGSAIWFLFAVTFLHGLLTSFTAWLFVMAFLGSAWCYVRLGRLAG